jgi:hypothetical protein
VNAGDALERYLSGANTMGFSVHTRVTPVEKLKKLDELPAAVAILDRGVSPAGLLAKQRDRIAYSCSRAKLACPPGREFCPTYYGQAHSELG